MITFKLVNQTIIYILRETGFDTRVQYNVNNDDMIKCLLKDPKKTFQSIKTDC